MNNLIKSLIVVLVTAVAVLQAKPIAEKGFVFTKGIGAEWSNCSNPSDPAKILNVTLNPDPPQKGKDLAVSVTVSLSETVTAGSVTIKLKAGIITVVHKTLDLCELAKDAGDPCPVKPGVHTIKITQSVPDISAHAKGNAFVKDQNGKELACINLDIHT